MTADEAGSADDEPGDSPSVDRSTGPQAPDESGDGDAGGSPPPAGNAPPVGGSRTRSALAWGGVAGLSFLVFHQAYLLTGGRFVGFGPVAAVAVAVGAAGTALAYALEGRLAARER